MDISTTLPAVNEQLSRLEQILREQLGLAERLKGILTDKRGLLISSRLDLLPPVLQSEEATVLELESRESARIALLAHIAAKTGIDREARLSEIIEILNIPARHPLRSLADKLKRIVAELREMNGVNATLTQNLVDYTSMVLRLIAYTSDKSSYDAGGDLHNEGIRRNLLDRRA